MKQNETKSIKKFTISALPTTYNIPSIVVNQSKDIYEVLRDIHYQEGNDIQEFFYVVFLNRANKVTGYYLASMGGITGTVADPRLILKAALLTDCVSIVLSHNHPSGNLKPSRADEELTLKIKQAALLVDIRVLDHIILSETSYYSFADEGTI